MPFSSLPYAQLGAQVAGRTSQRVTQLAGQLGESIGGIVRGATTMAVAREEDARLYNQAKAARQMYIGIMSELQRENPSQFESESFGVRNIEASVPKPVPGDAEANRQYVKTMNALINDAREQAAQRGQDTAIARRILDKIEGREELVPLPEGMVGPPELRRIEPTVDITQPGAAGRLLAGEVAAGAPLERAEQMIRPLEGVPGQVTRAREEAGVSERHAETLAYKRMVQEFQVDKWDQQQRNFEAMQKSKQEGADERWADKHTDVELRANVEGLENLIQRQQDVIENENNREEVKAIARGKKKSFTERHRLALKQLETYTAIQERRAMRVGRPRRTDVPRQQPAFQPKSPVPDLSATTEEKRQWVLDNLDEISDDESEKSQIRANPALLTPEGLDQLIQQLGGQ